MVINPNRQTAKLIKNHRKSRRKVIPSIPKNPKHQVFAQVQLIVTNVTLRHLLHLI
jgi:hypothetical protein